MGNYIIINYSSHCKRGSAVCRWDQVVGQGLCCLLSSHLSPHLSLVCRWATLQRSWPTPLGRAGCPGCMATGRPWSRRPAQRRRGRAAQRAGQKAGGKAGRVGDQGVGEARGEAGVPRAAGEQGAGGEGRKAGGLRGAGGAGAGGEGVVRVQGGVIHGRCLAVGGRASDAHARPGVNMCGPSHIDMDIPI